jgi:hypothetical protein
LILYPDQSVKHLRDGYYVVSPTCTAGLRLTEVQHSDVDQTDLAIPNANQDFGSNPWVPHQSPSCPPRRLTIRCPPCDKEDVSCLANTAAEEKSVVRDDVTYLVCGNCLEKDFASRVPTEDDRLYAYVDEGSPLYFHPRLCGYGDVMAKREASRLEAISKRSKKTQEPTLG